MKPKLPFIDRYDMPRPAQMHRGEMDDMSFGGCVINFILMVFIGMLALSCLGVNVNGLL